MRRALLCADKELRIRLRDRWAMLIYLILPLTIGGMVIAFAGGGSGPTPTAELLVVDQDESFLSQALLGALSQNSADQPIEAQTVTLEEGRALIADGEGSALLVIPAGFGEAVLKRQTATLSLTTNPAQQILPGIIEEFLKVLVDAVFYLHEVFGDELDVISAQVDALPEGQSDLFEDAIIAGIAVSVNGAIESIAEYLDPPILDVAEPEPGEDDEPGISFGMVFFPGTIFIGMLFAAQGMSAGFWAEREAGTLRRSLVSPLGPSDILIGKLLAGAAIMLMVAVVLTTAGFAYLGIGAALWLPTVLWLVLSGLVLFGLMALVQLFAPTRRVGSLVTDIMVFVLMMAGGAFFPFESLPDWFAAAGRWVPNGFMLDRLKAFLVYDGGLAALGTGLPIALAMAFLIWGVCAWRMKRFAGVG